MLARAGTGTRKGQANLPHSGWTIRVLSGDFENKIVSGRGELKKIEIGIDRHVHVYVYTCRHVRLVSISRVYQYQED